MIVQERLNLTSDVTKLIFVVLRELFASPVFNHGPVVLIIFLVVLLIPVLSIVGVISSVTSVVTIAVAVVVIGWAVVGKLRFNLLAGG